MRVGLNPYGLTWVLGLQGRGTPRSNPAGRGIAGLLDIADELGAKVVEIFDPWLRAMPDAEVAAIGARLAGRDQVPVVSAGIDMMGPMESAFRSARLLGARTIRLGLSPVLCGDRNAAGATLGRAQRPHPRGPGGMGAARRRRGLPLRHREPPGLHQRRARRLLRG